MCNKYTYQQDRDINLAKMVDGSGEKRVHCLLVNFTFFKGVFPWEKVQDVYIQAV